MKPRTQIVADIFFPKTCINCNKTGEYLCNDCKKKLTPHPEICPYCHKFSPNYQTCIDCKMSRHNVLEGIIIPFSYSKLIKTLIINFKYKHQKDLATFLAKRLAIILQTHPRFQTIQQRNPLLLSYIPSHRYRKHFIKGYNQAQVLAEELSKETKIPLIHILEKKEISKAQAGLKRNQRLVNLTGKFGLYSNTQLQGNETIILIDDVTTTNATLNEAALTIKNQYPYIKIRGLVLARHN